MSLQGRIFKDGFGKNQGDCGGSLSLVVPGLKDEAASIWSDATRVLPLLIPNSLLEKMVCLSPFGQLYQLSLLSVVLLCLTLNELYPSSKDVKG